LTLTIIFYIAVFFGIMFPFIASLFGLNYEDW